jgi:NAD(P)-dependent dehydrogenase (short-subunit alcohol dehydrogenase family)
MNAANNIGQKQVIWIVGGSSGIGLALAEGLLQQGLCVVVSARRIEALQTLAERFPESIQCVPVDVTEPSTLKDGLSAILAHWGQLDRVILNAADYAPMSLDDFDPALFERLMRINFMGVIHGIDAVRGHFLAQGAGEIIITASVAGFRGLPNAAPYGATKAALINMAESLAPEFAQRGVALRVINPGFVRTPLTDKNDFEMPGIIEPEEAARLIIRKLNRSGFELLVPTGFGLVMKLIRILPYRLFFALTRRMLKK